jgi:hypothetical protein
MAALASDAGTLQLGHPYERLCQDGKAKRLWRDRVQAKAAHKSQCDPDMASDGELLTL